MGRGARELAEASRSMLPLKGSCSINSHEYQLLWGGVVQSWAGSYRHSASSLGWKRITFGAQKKKKKNTREPLTQAARTIHFLYFGGIFWWIVLEHSQTVLQLFSCLSPHLQLFFIIIWFNCCKALNICTDVSSHLLSYGELYFFFTFFSFFYVFFFRQSCFFFLSFFSLTPLA